MPKIADVVGRPQVHFDDPVALAHEPSLNKDEKLVALANWERDTEHLEIADDEGMAQNPREEAEPSPIRDQIQTAAHIVQDAPKPVPKVDAISIDPDRHVKLPVKSDPSAA